ncbi:MAG: hypothetical protein DHS20C02_07110 [Micavibrio sp.]|nr:MAG: hypothetical protein DHS20C02_07110 [Micavibrio sp.]
MTDNKETEDKKENVAKEEATDKKETKKAAPKAKAKKAAPKKEAAKKGDKKDVAPKAEAKEKPVKDLKDIGEAVQAEAPAAAAAEVKDGPEAEQKPAPRVQKIDDLGRAYATGRRKDAVARVWLKPGSGRVVVNGRDQTVYFARQTQRLVLNQPFLIVNSVGKYDVMATVKGGGLSGQAGAVRHGISRALENYDPTLRPPLKKAGMLTRDDRIVERKKVGKHKARRSKQWAKR